MRKEHGPARSEPIERLSELWQVWRSDRLLGKVLRNTGYLFSSNTVSMILSSLSGCGAVAAFSGEYGILGMVTLYASTVNRLLSFRMGELVIRYAGQHLATDDRPRPPRCSKRRAGRSFDFRYRLHPAGAERPTGRRLHHQRPAVTR